MGSRLTFDQVLAEARDRQLHGTASPVEDWLVDTFSEAQPCGIDPPEVGLPGELILAGEGLFTPSEARWYAGELLRRADVAEAPETEPPPPSGTPPPFQGEF